MAQPHDEPPRSDPAEDPHPASPARPVATVPTLKTLSRSRVGVAWVGLILGAVVLVLLLIFIAQNGRSVQISFLGADGHLPLGVALLLAAVAGALIVAVPGSLRILQLRRAARRGVPEPAGSNPATGDITEP